MKAYYYDNLPGDQRLPHDSSRPLSPDYLSSLGIIHHHFPPSTPTEAHPEVDRIATARNYKNRDTITISPTTLPNYEEKVKNFFHEHLHEDEEIRYILDGGGYFDVRSEGDEWVRIKLERGDLMIMPAGIYHRFTTDEKDYTKAMRLFKEDPKWTPLNRGEETEGNSYRQEYVKMREAGGAVAA